MLKSLLIVGAGSFIGGAMRFLLSTFANESVQMLQHGNTFGFVGYVATSVIAGFLLIALGYWIVKAL